MSIKRKFPLAVITIGIAVSIVGCSFVSDTQVAPPPVSSASVIHEPTSSAAKEASILATESNVTAFALHPAVSESPVAAIAPVANVPIPVAVPVIAAPAPEPVPAKAASAPVKAAPAPVPAKAVPAPAPVKSVPVAAKAAAPAVSREVYVGLTGGQSVVNLERGPVLFTLPAGFPPYVAEHDAAGGWARFGTLSAGMTVRMSGLVTGTYTVGQIINVPKGANTNEFSKFNVKPKAVLQTCVPGTTRMIIVGLY